MFEKIAEQKIREAMANGEFDDLPGKGKPIDLSGYFDMPEHLRVGYTLLKKHGFVPEEVALMREIGEAREELAGCEPGERRRRLTALVEERLLKLNLVRERTRRSPRSG